MFSEADTAGQELRDAETPLLQAWQILLNGIFFSWGDKICNTVNNIRPLR